MSQVDEDGQASLRIVYWGNSGAGKTATLRALHAKLSADRRGELQSIPTRLDPTMTYEQFSVRLGKLAGRDTQLLLIAVPGACEAVQTRKQLLDRTDGIVWVCDPCEENQAANLEALGELRESLAAYGRSLEEIPVVVQYNKRDLADSFELESLHRQIQIPGAAVFETVATKGVGVLQALTAVSKRAARTLKSGTPEASLAAEDLKPLVQSAPASSNPVDAGFSTDTESESGSITTLMEAAILADGEDSEAEELDGLIYRAQSSFADEWPEADEPGKSAAGARISHDLKIVSVGTAHPSGERAISVPLVLGNDAGESVSLSLTIRLDPMLEEDSAE
ncbi:MAG: GTPase domain-containing protein [Myxococcota bacterium]